MKVTPNPTKAVALLQEARVRNEHPRDMQSLHLTELLTCLRRAYYTRVVGIPADSLPAESLRVMLGSAFHKWLEDRPERPIEWHGILGSPDRVENAMDIDADTYPLEIKSTKYSANRVPPADLNVYVDQAAGYALMLDSDFAQLAVLHIDGDYAEHRDPIFRVYDLKFTPDELVRWQKELLRRAGVLQTALEIGQPPPTNERLKRQDSCQYCPFYKLICDGGRTHSWGRNFAETETQDIWE